MFTIHRFCPSRNLPHSAFALTSSDHSVLKIKYLIICLLLLPSFSFTQNNLSERDYADYIQRLIGGEREYSVYSGRVDLVTEDFAYEIEWAKNWKESIGQSLWYALQTKLKPGIILIRESPKEYKYFQMLNSTLQFSGLEDKIKVLIFPDDFEDLIQRRAEE